MTMAEEFEPRGGPWQVSNFRTSWRERGRGRSIEGNNKQTVTRDSLGRQRHLQCEEYPRRWVRARLRFAVRRRVERKQARADDQHRAQR
jgi:hypothetical protein